MHNDKYLTITALTKYLKYKFDSDDNLRQIFLKGEISNLKFHTTGHLYFSLKDETSKINAIMFNTSARRLVFKPTDGMNVLVTGRISVYEATGNYQIYVDNGVLVGDIMHILHLLGVKAYEAEVELLHLGYVPLQRLQYHIVTGGYVYRAAQALLRAYQYAVDGGIELRHDALTLLECHISLYDIYRSVGEAFTDITLI